MYFSVRITFKGIEAISSISKHFGLATIFGLDVRCFNVYFIKCHFVAVNLNPNIALQQFPKCPKCQVEKIQRDMRDPVLAFNQHQLKAQNSNADTRQLRLC